MRATSNSTYLEGAKNIFHSGAARQIAFMLGVAVSVALGIVLYMSIKEPIYQPLDYQVNQQNMSAIVDTLEKAGIQYKINDRDGVILVPSKDAQTARLKLSAAGVTKDDGFNYSFLNEQNSFANSQFIENARYLRALENDLSKTIGAIEGVSAARVHIAVPQNNVFADENNKVTASVMLNMTPGFSTDKEKIRSIIQLVADSVPGLDPKDIAISDQYGHLLSDSFNQDAIYSSAPLTYQNNIQGYYEKRIQTMIAPIIGENKVTVRVNADIDFTQQEDAQEQYDPDKKVLRSEQSMTDQTESSGASGPPGSLSNQPPEESGKSQASGGSGSGQSRNQSTKNYDVTKSVTYKKSNFAKIKSLSVAVVVDNEMVMDPKTNQYVNKPLAADKIAKITDLVKATIGFDSARGDKVTVVNSVYSPVKQDIPVNPIHIWEKPWFWDVLQKVIGIPLGFLFLFILYRRLTRYADGGGIRTKKIKAMVGESDDDDEKNSIAKLHEFKQEGMTKLKQLAVTEPTLVAHIIKNWVGKQ